MQHAQSVNPAGCRPITSMHFLIVYGRHTIPRYRFARNEESCARSPGGRLAPRVGLAGPAAIGKIVCQAFARAGLRPACRGAAHLFRHGLATTMIRHGASMAEIAEVLRHRSQDSTAIYAKIAFEDLRGGERP
ncbi:tyrosine-type recombinase/integrase [Paraburkholderia humisilvae]|uniref:tyrosine-type recombinase/integrase n=1 Tax=Paraburkholderia humisilvae TaxID=627669 RepID=UPI00360AF6E1